MIKYFKHEFIEGSEIRENEAFGIPHFRDTYDCGLLVLHERIGKLGDTLQSAKYSYHKGMSKVEYSTGEVAFNFLNGERFIFKDGQTIYPKNQQNGAKLGNGKSSSDRVEIIPSVRIDDYIDIDDRDTHLILPRKRELMQLESPYKEFNRYNIPLVHGPDTDAVHKDFEYVLAWIKGNFGCGTITLHPGKSEKNEIVNSLKESADVISKMGVILAYENMDYSDRWFLHPWEINEIDLPFVKLTLDTSHVEPGTDLSQIVDSVFDKLSVVHLSNRTGNEKHLPFRQGDHDITKLLHTLKMKNYKGFIVLDYQPKFKSYEEKDLKKVKEMFGE